MRNEKVIIEYLETLPELPVRSRTGHKGTYGAVLGIGGSRGMAGAVALAGRAALLAGAGLSRLAVPDPVLETVAGFFPEITTLPCSADRKGRFSNDALEALLKHAESATACFLGPGLGRSAGLDVTVPLLLKRSERPFVVDADALNALASMGSELLGRFFAVLYQRQPNRPVILTPHPGEFSRLIGALIPSENNPSRIRTAESFARQHHVILVLKGHETVVTDGNRTSLNPTGNPGMATGGSGDVLTGTVAGLLAQGFSGFDAARLGVFLHGLAGDLAASQLGEESVTAGSILDSLPQAFCRFRDLK